MQRQKSDLTVGLLSVNVRNVKFSKHLPQGVSIYRSVNTSLTIQQVTFKKKE